MLARPVTFNDARAAVTKEFSSSYAGPGTFYVDTSGWEDILDYLVSWGAREWIVDRDPAFNVPTGLCTFVDRRSGDVRQESMPRSFDKIDAMTLVSVPSLPSP